MKHIGLALILPIAGCGGKSAETRVLEMSPTVDGATPDTSPAATPTCTMQKTELADLSGFVSSSAYTFYGAAISGGQFVVALDRQFLPMGSRPNDTLLIGVPIQGGAPKVIAGLMPGPVVGFAAVPSSNRIVCMNRPSAPMNESENTLLSIPTTGGSPTTLATGVFTNSGITVDTQNVYWADNWATNSVYSVPLDGGLVHTIIMQSVSWVSPYGDALLLSDDVGGRILSMPIAGGPTTVLATNQVKPIAAHDCGGGSICWSNMGSAQPGGPITTSTKQDAALMRRDPQGQIGVLLSGNYGIIYDGDHDLFAASGGLGGGVIVRVPLDGNPPVTIVTMSTAGPMAVDNRCLYWVDNQRVFTQDKSVPGM
jgi:hypothetical protein